MKQNTGFTMIELLVVLSIITLMAIFSTASLSTSKSKSRDARRIADVTQIQLALSAYFDDQEMYPQYVTSGESLSFVKENGEPIIYLEVVPSNPLPSDDGNCPANVTNYYYQRIGLNSYTIQYCLGGPFYGFVKAGTNYATPRYLSAP